jgi:hypothetical protein
VSPQGGETGDQARGNWFGLSDEQRDRLMDLVSTIMLSIAVALTAFSAWQSTLWSSEQAEDYVRGSSLRAQSNAALILGTTEVSYDATSFALSVIEYYSGDEDAVEFFETRLFRDEFKPALDAWLATDPLNNPDAPKTPFDVPEFANANFAEWQTLAAQAEQEINDGNTANRNADNYILATVMFAAVLFFTGIVMKLRHDGLRVASLAMALAALIFASGYMLTLPKLFHT